MKKIFSIMITVCMALTMSVAFAGGHDNGGGDDAHAPSFVHGGEGGHGGRGGDGGHGGSAHSNANANNHSTNMQGQVGIVRGGNQDTDVSNRNSNTVRGGNQDTSVDASRRNSNTVQGGNQMQGQVGINRNGSVSGSQKMDGNSVNGGSINITDNSRYDAQKRNPVSSAFAAPLTSSNDTCMGSSSASGQGVTFGLSFATTWRDKDCVIRKDARFLHNAGLSKVSLSLMCEKDSVKKAVARAGTPEQKAACGISDEK